jgi:hypothetical protein
MSVASNSVAVYLTRYFGSSSFQFLLHSKKILLINRLTDEFLHYQKLLTPYFSTDKLFLLLTSRVDS